MRARLTEDQELLRSSARDLLEAECPVSRVREWTADATRPAPIPDAVWKRIAELGWTGLVVPEAYGGSGLGMLELALVLEEAGRTLLPGPFASTAVFGGFALVLGGSEEQRRTFLPGVAVGTVRAALALAEEDGSFDPEDVALRLGADGRLSGTKRFVQDGLHAERLLVVARNPEGALCALWIPSDSPGLSLREVPLMDATRSFADVELDGVVVSADATLPGGAQALSALLDRARVALAAECCGGARRALELAVAYAGTREQFGQPIGRFQAIQHRCADMLVQVESAVSATWYAAWCLDAGDPAAHAAACAAKAVASDAFCAVAGACIQIHGGLGFTWEQDPQLYYKRAKVSELLLGDAGFHRELLARAVLDTPGTP